MVVGAAGMRACVLIALFGVLAGVFCGPVTAMPFFTEAEPIPAVGYEAVTLRLFHEDGVFLSDPTTAVVVSRDGTLLAASPVSMSLRIFCEGFDLLRQCLAYDDIARTVYQPDERGWRDSGLIDKDGQAQSFPETLDFGFVGRPATLGEIVSFEIAGLTASWQTTGVALVWWTAFWLLLMPVAHLLLGRSQPPTITALVALLVRTAGALLMIPVTAYAWLMAPYSGLYLGFVVLSGAIAAHLMTGRRKPSMA